MIYTHALAAILAAALAGWGAWSVQDWRYGAKEAERLEAVAELAKMNAKAADVAATGHEADKAKAKVQFRTIYQEVERVVEKPVYRNICIDDDGMRLVAAAIGSKPAASQPETGVPGLKPPGGWLGRIRAAVGAADNRDVSRLPEPPAETR